MLILIAAAAVSFIPSVLLYLYLRKNREDEEYKQNCTSLFLQGVVICGLVLLLDLGLVILWNLTGLGKDSMIVNELFKCFVINATVEETSKFLVANKFIKKDKKVSRLDIMAYLMIAAISFGLLEDVVYVFSTNAGQIIVRGILMGHVPYEILMGYLYGKAIAEDKSYLKVFAFLFPILLHGTYNFCLNEGLGDWAAFVVVTEVIIEFIYMICMIFFIRKKRNDPEFTRPLYPQEETAE